MSRRNPPNIEGLHSVKVDNISYNTTQNDLRRMFDRYGEIGDIHIPRDRYTRQSKGFGFVRFYNRKDAEYALERLDGKYIDGRELRVSIAKYERPIDDRGREIRKRSRSPPRRSRSRSPRGRSRSRSPRRTRSRSPIRRSRSRSRSHTPPRGSRSRSASRSPRRSPSPKRERPERSPSPGRSRSRSRSASRSRSPVRD